MFFGDLPDKKKTNLYEQFFLMVVLGLFFPLRVTSITRTTLENITAHIPMISGQGLGIVVLMAIRTTENTVV